MDPYVFAVIKQLKFSGSGPAASSFTAGSSGTVVGHVPRKFQQLAIFSCKILV